ncbi:MAG: hypothetical protein VCD31_01410, partial [Alphaproteobacteria bacterium]
MALLSGQPLLVGSPARAEDNSSAGRRDFKQCRNCHSVRQENPAPSAPISTRWSAASPALAGAGFSWTPELLDRWLADPQAILPGTEMEF